MGRFLLVLSGRSYNHGMWDDYIIAEISMKFEKLKEIDRFATWLETQNGRYQLESFVDREFEKLMPIEYLDLKKINGEIGYSEDDVCDETYSLIKHAASDYYFEND